MAALETFLLHNRSLLICLKMPGRARNVSVEIHFSYHLSHFCFICSWISTLISETNGVILILLVSVCLLWNFFLGCNLDTHVSPYHDFFRYPKSTGGSNNPFGAPVVMIGAVYEVELLEKINLCTFILITVILTIWINKHFFSYVHFILNHW